MPEVLPPLRELLARLLWVKGAERARPCRRNNFKHVARDEHRLVRLVARDVEAQLDGAELTPDFAGAVLLTVQHDKGRGKRRT